MPVCGLGVSLVMSMAETVADIASLDRMGMTPTMMTRSMSVEQVEAADGGRAGDDEGKSSDGQRVRPGTERTQAPAPSSAAPVPAPTASGRS